MRNTSTSGYRGQRYGNGDTPFAVFMRGMDLYACTEHTVAASLAKMAAAVGVGIVIGIFAYFFFGVGADMSTLVGDYVKARAFTSYPSVREYTAFLSSWYFHHAVWLLSVFVLALTVYPGAFLGALCGVRGAVAGFSVCVLANGFSLFSLYYAFAQGALCALLATAAAKAACYGIRRRTSVMASCQQFSFSWLCGEVAPVLAGMLLCLFAQLLGMLFVSLCCSFIV